MKVHEKQLQKCIDLMRKEVACIEEDTFNLLNENKLTDDKSYMFVYNMNQNLHNIKHIIDTYCSGKGD